jgi:alkylation response protein AidB-like acyl-CoA dehydrogenase
MDFEYTKEEEAFRQEVRDWYRENLPEGWIEGDRDLPEDREEREEFLLDWQRKLYDARLTAIHWPEEYGGRDASLKKQLIHRQEKARFDPPEEIAIVGIQLVGPAIEDGGTEEQKERFLKNILKGEELWCQGYSEPNSGSDVANLQCRAYDEGDHFRIDGKKIWTTNAHRADWCFLLTRTDTEGPKYHGITVLLVDMSQDEVIAEPIRQANNEASFNEVYFDDAVAKKEHVVGEVDDGWRVAMTQLAFERLALSQALTLEQRLKELVEFCHNTNRDGKPLSEHPHVRQELAELHTRFQAAKLTFFRNGSTQIHTGEAGSEVSFGKLYDNEVNKDFQRFRLKLLGPEGALRGDDQKAGDWQAGFLSDFGRRIGGGTQDVQRNIIGERVLDLPKGLQNMDVGSD